MLETKARISARLAVASGKAGSELGMLLDKWFEKHFVKGITLPLAKGMHATGTMSGFEEAMQGYGDQTVVAVVRKLDPHCISILSRPRQEMLAHILALASGAQEPAGRPKVAKAPKAPTVAKPRKPGGVLANARQG